MARNRKRAKDRRARQPQRSSVGGRASGLGGESSPLEHDETHEAPDPIEHAAPDVELAAAQVALGRPDMADGSEPAPSDEQLEREAEESGPALTPAGSAVAAERRPGIGSRLVTFAQGSWRELQRVQWPDRRQVMQATGVVIGFVIVAGAFLGVSDFLAQKLVTFILK